MKIGMTRVILGSRL